jgi:hypothetical protein
MISVTLKRARYLLELQIHRVDRRHRCLPQLRQAARGDPRPRLHLGGRRHINSMITEHNFARGNVGIIFWSDILIPLIGLVCL